MNLSKRGVSSFTVGRRGSSINVGRRGTFLNLGIPGTGVSFRHRISVPRLMTRSVSTPRRASFLDLTDQSSLDLSSEELALSPAIRHSCPQCRETLSESSHFCDQCGYAITAAELARDLFGHDPDSIRRRRFQLIGISIGLGLLAILALEVLLLPSSHSESQDAIVSSRMNSVAISEASKPSPASEEISAPAAESSQEVSSSEQLPASPRLIMVPVVASAAGLQAPVGLDRSAAYVQYTRSLTNFLSDLRPEAVSFAGLTSGPVIRFTVLPDGALKDVDIRTSSGSPAIDHTCMNNLRQLEYDNPLPEGVERLFVTWHCDPN